MKVLLVNGSPHQKGCTHTALDVVAKALNDDGIGCDEFWVGNQAVSGGHRFLHKPAAAVMNARRAGTTATWDQLNKYFGLMQMPIITSRYWNMVHGQTPFEVKQDLEGMQTMAVLGHNMAYFLKCKDAGERMGVAKPMDQPFVFTNFIH